MKKIIIALGVIIAQNFAIAQNATSFGHRDGLNPVMDIETQKIETIVLKSFAEFKDVHLISAELNDQVAVVGYMPSLIMKVGYREPGEDSSAPVKAITFQFMLKYDPVTNGYMPADGDPIVNGGRAYCRAISCVGCQAQRDEKGRLINCSPCTPLDPHIKYSCDVIRPDGGGDTVGILTAIAGILTALAGFF